MNRRASLPGADELFRPTGGKVTSLRADPTPPPRPPRHPAADGRASGRTSHDEKITVYLSQQELLDLEQARLRLRAEFGLHVDRGRIVREAVALLLADLRARGPDAAIVRNLT
ncbi:MAG: hypothetical protein M3N32_07540 [Actinomycetota bacterium]|nr:hypothetical protein [Actinomycetota bacterium]